MRKQNEEWELRELEVAAACLVAAGRRDDAIALVQGAVGPWDASGGLLFLARLQLGRGTRDSLRAAVDALQMWRAQRADCVEGVALLRSALRQLGRHVDVQRLDREIRWTGLSRFGTERPAS